MVSERQICWESEGDNREIPSHVQLPYPERPNAIAAAGTQNQSRSEVHKVQCSIKSSPRKLTPLAMQINAENTDSGAV